MAINLWSQSGCSKQRFSLGFLVDAAVICGLSGSSLCIRKEHFWLPKPSARFMWVPVAALKSWFGFRFLVDAILGWSFGFCAACSHRRSCLHPVCFAQTGMQFAARRSRRLFQILAGLVAQAKRRERGVQCNVGEPNETQLLLW